MDTFLKIPSAGERAAAGGGGALKLSPQLARSSKIPCRNSSGYEGYHSPVLGRKATTTERDRQPSSSSSSSSRTEQYPATHSAPTSPPKPEDDARPPPLAKEVIYSSHSAPKLRSSAKASCPHPQRGPPKAPHYENVCPSDGTSRYLSCSAHSEGASGNAPQREEQPFSPAPSQHTDSSPGPTGRSSDRDASDQDTGSDSHVWHKSRLHFSLPSASSSSSSSSSSAFSANAKAHGDSSCSATEDKHPGRVTLESAQPNCEGPQAATPAARGSGPSPGSSSAPRRPGGAAQGKPQSDLSHLPFKERLAALGKLKSTEEIPAEKRDAQGGVAKPLTASDAIERSKTAERGGALEHRPPKHTDSLDGKPCPKTGLTATPAMPKGEQETFSPRVFGGKAEGPKIKMGVSSTEPPPVMRSYGKCPITQSHHGKTAPIPQNSPSKVPSKSPSKAGQASSYPRGLRPASEDRTHIQRPPARPEERGKLTAGKKKPFAPAESLPPPPPLPPRAPAVTKEEKKPFSPGPPGPQSAIEQKVMRGIEENMLKLQEQDRGPAPEPKHKTSNGIASWFGLRKSKLPALSRKPDASKPKTASSSPAGAGGSDPQVGHRKVVESLNISKLMEKAEDLRKALEEERAYVNGVGVAMQRAGRGHSCEVVMDQTQGQLSLMYRGVATDNFMQQLLNRVDERDVGSFGMAHRRLSFDSKRSRPLFSIRNGMSHTKSGEEVDTGSDMVGKDEATSDESLADSITSQHFTGSGASMRTLDSGIGTFPLPDYGSSITGKSAPKGRPQGETGFPGATGKHGALMKVPRKARTLERELSSLEEVSPAGLYGSGVDGKAPSMHLASTIHEDIDAYGAHVQTPPTKNWTFPSLKGSARGGAADVYLDVQGELGGQGGPPTRSVKQCPPQGALAADPGGHLVPPQMGLGRRGKGRAPGAPDVGRDGGLELVRERPEDILSPSRAPALETPESLSDSLYDSLSSCGSQG